MDTREVGDQLVSLCRDGKNLEAIEKLYSSDIVSVEPMEMPNMPAEQQGIEAIRGKNEWWYGHNEVHSGNADGPFVNGDRFTVKFEFDVTAKDGERAGQRNTFREIALYTVKDGKIVREEFYY